MRTAVVDQDETARYPSILAVVVTLGVPIVACVASLLLVVGVCLVVSGFTSPLPLPILGGVVAGFVWVTAVSQVAERWRDVSYLRGWSVRRGAARVAASTGRALRRIGVMIWGLTGVLRKRNVRSR